MPTIPNGLHGQQTITQKKDGLGAVWLFSALILCILKEVPLLTILKRNVSSNFSPGFLSICKYRSGKKTACYRPSKNRHFVRVCTKKMMDYQYRENGARNIYSNYNQMRTYVECSPSQSKKLYLIDLSIEQSTKLWGFRNSAGRFCISILPEYCSSALTAQI